jgi:uncharacterized protein YaeQ
MALKSTIFKAELQVSDLDRGHFETHALTIARHPSETDERMMVRLLAFALDADERLAFGRGLSSEGEADLAQVDLTGAIDLWIDVGLPDEREVRKAAGRAARVKLYLYGGRAASLWWRENEAALARLDNVAVLEVPEDVSRDLAGRAERTMRSDCTIQEGEVWWSSPGAGTLHFRPVVLQAARRP